MPSSSLKPHSSLGRRRSSFCLHAPQPPSPPPPPVVPTDTTKDSMLVVVASRILQWLHLHPDHSLTWPSSPSSPRSSTDDLVLPLSASAQKTTFDTTVTSEKQPNSTHHFPPIHAPILLVICLLPISTALVLYCMSTLPISLSWPRTIGDVAQLGRELTAYTQSGIWPLLHVMGVMAISAIWKHAWSIPGSVIWNVLAGALFTPAPATLFLTALTTMGSLCATLLSTPLAPFLMYMFPRALDMTRAALGGGDSELDQDLASTEPSKTKSSTWVRLSVLRLIGVVPWSGINIACGVCGVALTDCILGTFIGCLPWTAVTCQIGDILQTVASTPSPTPESISSLLMSPQIIFKLVFLSFLSLAPILGRDRLRMMISPSVKRQRTATLTDERTSRFTWARDWRKKIRIASQSRSRDRTTSAELNILIQEKRALEQLPS